jgi:hypothetical protein
MKMAFRKPITTLGGLLWWSNIRQDTHFILQTHSVGLPVWPYKYRILMRENRMEIANSNDREEIELDWAYLEKYAVPQLDQAINVFEIVAANSDTLLQIVLKVIKFLP